jgi:CxxC motif-containing protein
MLTTTVKVKGGIRRRLPVVSNGEISKALLRKCIDALYSIEVKAPVHVNDVVMPNILDTGVNIVAGKEIAAA